MKKVEILVVGTNVPILETVVRLINQNAEWRALGATDTETAQAYFQKQIFDLVILGGGIDPDDERRLAQVFKAAQPHVKVVQHFGGGSGLLYNEIRAALDHADLYSLL